MEVGVQAALQTVLPALCQLVSTALLDHQQTQARYVLPATFAQARTQTSGSAQQRLGLHALQVLSILLDINVDLAHTVLEVVLCQIVVEQQLGHIALLDLGICSASHAR